MILFFLQLYPQHLLQQVRPKLFVLFLYSLKLNLNLSILEFWANFSSKCEQQLVPLAGMLNSVFYHLAFKTITDSVSNKEKTEFFPLSV